MGVRSLSKIKQWWISTCFLITHTKFIPSFYQLPVILMSFFSLLLIYFFSLEIDMIIPIAYADINSQKSLHTLLIIWLYHTCWWSLNKIVWSELHKVVSFLRRKWFTMLTKNWHDFGRRFCNWNNYCLVLNF